MTPSSCSRRSKKTPWREAGIRWLFATLLVLHVLHGAYRLPTKAYARRARQLDAIESADAVVWTVQSIDDAGTLRRFRLRLAWPDYDVWSPDGGMIASGIIGPDSVVGVASPDTPGQPEVVEESLVNVLREAGVEVVYDVIGCNGGTHKPEEGKQYPEERT